MVVRDIEGLFLLFMRLFFLSLENGHRAQCLNILELLLAVEAG